MTNQSDSELVARAATGDRDAFQLLLERHYEAIFAIAYRFSGNAPNAEDIAQDVCIKLVGALKSFRGQARFSTWLYQVVLNAVRDRGRKRSSRTAAHASFSEVNALAQADAAHSKTRSRWLEEALGQLSRPLRETALLVVAEELSHAEAAEVLGCAETTVSWRMGQVKTKLKSLAEMANE